MSDNLTQKAYRHIHGKLSGGQLPPGSRLSNRGVAKEVGVSFTPVREALNRLVSEGLLEYRQGLGVFVPILNIQEIREIYELREILESEAASRVCENPTPNMIAEMSNSCDLMADIYEQTQADSEGSTLGDRADAWQAADSAFHMALLRAAGNRRLLDTVEGLRTSLKAMLGVQMAAIAGRRFVSEPRNHIKRTLDEHRRILEALKKGHGDDARAVMIEHIRSGLEQALAAHNHNHMEGTNPLLRGAYGR